MKQDVFNKLVEECLQEVKDILVKKTAEYNIEDDRLSIFKHAANLEQTTSSQALLGFVAKQITSLYEMVKSEKVFKEEIWDEKIVDIINYMILLKGTLTDDKKINKK